MSCPPPCNTKSAPPPCVSNKKIRTMPPVTLNNLLEKDQTKKAMSVSSWMSLRFIKSKKWFSCFLLLFSGLYDTQLVEGFIVILNYHSMSDLVSGCTISGEHGRVRRARVRSSLGSPLCVLPYSLDRYIYFKYWYILSFTLWFLKLPVTTPNLRDYHLEFWFSLEFKINPV